ncbi:MAG: ankyrin repeat domain-containing protein [Phycisphaerae bacterium]|nr:ankyrin repeat domain-containing protein [Phycisphaerae bacterium]
MRLLLARGADANTADHNGDTVLSDACSLALVEIAELLLRHGADPRWTHRRNKETALHAAARSSPPDPRIVDVMHDAGADLNARSHLDETPLDACVLMNNTTIARRLLERGADVNLGHECFGPPLHHAADDDKLAMIDLLIDFGASIELLNGDDETPLMIAVRHRQWAAAARLLARGANPETRNSAGKVAADFVIFPEDQQVWQSLHRAPPPPPPV